MATPFSKVAVAASAISVDAREAPRIARRLGFSGLTFSVCSPALDLTTLSTTGQREFRHLLEAQNQQLVGLSVDWGRQGLGPGADVDRALAQLERAMEAARGLSAPLIHIDIGPLPPAPVVPKPKPTVNAAMAGFIILPDSMTTPEPIRPAPPPRPADAALEAHIDAAMFELGQRADRLGVLLAFRNELASFASLLRLLKRADCPSFGVDLDPVAMLGDEWEMDAIFDAVAPLILHVRGRDAIIGAGHRTKPAAVGQGDVDWDALLARLDEAGYAGWITLDPTDLPDRTAAAAEGRKWIDRSR